MTAPRGEGDDLAAAANHAGHDLAVLTFVVHQEQTVLAVLRRERILQHVLERRRAGLVHTAQRLFHHAAHAAGEVARADELISILRKAEIQTAAQDVLDLVDRVVDLLGHLWADRALGQIFFRSQQLVELAEDRAAAFGDDLVHHAADSWVRGQSARGVRAAALRRHHQLAQRAGHTLLPGKLRGELPADRDRALDGLGHAALLLDHELRHRLSRRLHGVVELLRIKSLAAETDHDHSPRVGMAAHRLERTGCQFQIEADLRAPHAMRHGDRPGDLRRDLLRRGVGTENGGQNDEIISCTYRAIRSAVTHKCMFHSLTPSFLSAVAAHIVVVDPRSLRRVGKHIADLLAIFDHGVSRLQILNAYLMCEFNILQQNNLFSGRCFYRIALVRVLQHTDNGIGRIDH